MHRLHSASDYLEISYQTDAQVLIARWLRPVTEDEALRDYAELLATARHFDAHYWLFDIRRRGRSAPATIDWLLTSYYPQVVRELGPPVRLAYFMAPGLRQEFMTDGTVPEPATYTAQLPFRMNQCITEAEAIGWLHQEQSL